MSERESFMFPDGRILYVPTDEEDAAINAGIEADPEERRSTELERAGKLRKSTGDELHNTLAYRMREAALRKARERKAAEAAAQADTEDE